jgi:hypothetical protein
LFPSLGGFAKYLTKRFLPDLSDGLMPEQQETMKLNTGYVKILKQDAGIIFFELPNRPVLNMVEGFGG